MDLADVTIETFEGREGETFSIQFADAKLELTLASVDPLPEDFAQGKRERAFSLIFHGPEETVLPQQTWPLDHDELGRLDLFLVPLGPEEGAMRYEAAFN